MKKLIIHVGLIVLALVLVVGCTSDDSKINIDPSFQKYVDRFVEAALEREIVIDFSDTGLEVQFDDLPEESAGECSELGSFSSGSHRIRISTDFWQEADELAKEVLIFHELGHCELGRIHDNQIFSTMDWKSIMRGFPLPQKDPAVNFTGIRKSYYLDELFNTAVNFPAWLNYIPSEMVSESQLEIVDILTNPKEPNIVVPAMKNFLIDFNFSKITKLGQLEIRLSRGAKKHWDFELDEDHVLTFAISEIGVLNRISLEKKLQLNMLNNLIIRKLDGVIDIFVNDDFLYWIEVDDSLLEALTIPKGIASVAQISITKIDL